VLTVASKPSITTQPTNQSVIALTNATFSLQATGTMPLTYTWMKNGTTPVGINNDSLSLLSVSAADDNSWYQCQVKNTVDSVLSAACTLHVITSIGNISYSQKFLSAVINTAFIPDTPTVVGNVSKYSISPQLPSGVKIDSLTGIISGTPTIQVDSTIYTIAASNGSGGNSTANLGIKVFSPIKVTTSPVSQTAAVKGSGKFFVVANGSKPYTYTWMSINPAGPVGGNSDTLTLTGIDTTFNGKSYKCIVQNSFQNNTYFDTSKACTLHVILPPKITTQPAAQTVLRNSKPVFSVTAGGTPPFSYVWIRNGTDTVGISNPDTLGLVAAINDKSTYRCIARNVSGADISALCTLRVVSAAFGGSPQSGLDSLTVAFVDSSTGGVSVRKWDFGDGTADSVQNPKHKYTVPNTYAVKLKVTSGAVSDSLIKANFVTVSYSKPKPNFSGTPITAQDSITVKFTDLSTGAVTSRQWSFGDSAVDTAKNPVHTYTKPGSFTVTLTVTGPGGTASSVQAAYIYVYSKKDNPIRIAGRRLSTTKVELTFTNYDSIPTSKSTQPPPWADSVGLYFRRDSLPSSTQAGTLVQTMNIPLIQGLARPFKDTVTVSYSGPADSVYYGFATALNWSDATKSAIAGGNATLVFMKDTAHFGNGLVISGAYLGVDTAGINLDKISGLDTGAIDSVELWYGFRDSANFSDASYTRKFSAISVINAAFGNRFTYKVRDPRFNSDTVSIFAAVELIGKNRLTSPENDTSFVVGRVRPQNPIKLTAKATSPSVIKLSWNKITGFDRIRIWKGLSAVPPGPDNITSSQYDTLIPNPTDTVMSVTGLTAKTWYFFGAQALQNNLWSTVTDSASAKDSTPAAVDTTKIVNTIKIRKFVFDSTRGALVIAWHVDTLDTNFKVGIEYSLKGYPTDSTIAPTQTAIIKSKTDSAVVTLKEPLALNATYYASMWISKGAKWALPTDSSKAKTTTPLNAPWQLVRYFDAAHDTVFAFGGRVMLASESMTDTFLIADTLRLFSATVSGLNGLVPVSVGFSFTNASDRLNVGLKVDTLLIPKGYTFADVRIYRQDSTGLYAVENGTVLNAAGGSVWLLTKDLGNPFIAMINTMKPNVKILNSLAGAVLANRALYDTIQITDNILNDSWVFRYTKGANSYANADDTSGSTWGLIDTIIVKASATSVNGGSGLRAMFVTSNGVHSDTQNVSRQVVRDSSANVVSTTEMQWTPLWVTAQLADSTAKIALKGLAGKNGWVYDNTQFRLFRWYAYPGNSAMDDKYLEYADSISDLFYFKPGRLFWLKTRTHSVFQLGSGITSDLNKAVSLTIEPHQMADIAVPYDFPLLVGDIIASTNANSLNISETGDSLIGDSLYYYNFILDAATNKYHTELLYINDGRLNKTAPMSKTDTLTSGFFCVYNPFKTSVSLSIPGIPAVMSKQSALSKKTQASEGWSVRVVGRTSEGSVLSSVYCGQVNGAPSPIKYYPAVQLIDGAGIRVCDQNLRQWGHAMARGDCAKDGGVTYLLAFTGTTGSLEKITYHAENTDGLPKGLRAIVLDPGSDSVAEASTELRASVGDFRKLVIGNDSYIAKAKAINKFYRLALVGVSPNPFGRMLRIRYSLPYTGVSRVEFSMIDLRGREFWALHGQTGAGPRELVWNGLGAGKHPVAAGMYVLRMKALDDKGKIAGVFQKRVTYLP
jgi:PKD repeat protein